MKKYWQNIDLWRLAGYSSILGIDLTEERACIVEVKRCGSIINRQDIKPKILHYFTLQFAENTPWNKKGEILKSELALRGIKTRLAVSSIQSIGIKTIRTSVPIGSNINEWIIEHQEKLLRLPVAKNDISFTYNLLAEKENELDIEIIFVRTENINNYLEFAQGAGIDWTDLTVGIINENELTEISLPECPSEYRVASILATKSFIPFNKNASILPVQHKLKTENIIFKTLFQRIIIVAGSILMILLLIQSLAGYYISSSIETIENQLSENGNSYSEVKSLEKQINDLDAQIQRKKSDANSSVAAQLLHIMAISSPDGLWFYRVKYSEIMKGRREVVISGYTSNREKITEFLKLLSEQKLEVNLVRSGTPLQSENLVPINSGQQFVTFEIKVSNR